MDFDHKYLTEDMLKGFNSYKYSAIDTNPLSIYVMHPFWDRVVLLCPRWMAPNLLTFLGFAFTLVAWVLLAFYDFDFESGGDERLPRWTLILSPVLVFIGYTLDGIDGKQARRTKTSGPLGELFDHGLDSVSAVLIPTCLYSVFGRSTGSVPPVRYYCVLWNVFLTFYLTHWEKYITGTLFLPWGYDLSMLSSIGVFFTSFVLREDMLRLPVGFGYTTGNALELVFYATSICATLPVTLYNIYLSYKMKKGRNLTVAEALRPMFSLGGLMLVTVYWALNSPSNIVERHPRAFYMLTGTVFSNITCRLVVAQMSGTRCDGWNALINYVAAGYVLSSLLSFTVKVESAVVYALWAYVTFKHFHYGTCVVRQMCNHLGIRCFKINPPKGD